MKSNDKIKTRPDSLYFAGGRVGVLLVHSLGGSPIELRFVAQALARLGYTVHCPLLPGLAGGTDVLGLSTWKDWYAGVEQAHDALKQTCDIVYVGGLSAGSMLALKLAADRSEQIRGLMLFAPTLWPNGWAIPKSLHLFRIVQQKWLARLFKFRQREPYGIKDERIRNFVVDSFKGPDQRPIENLFTRGGGMVMEFRLLVKEVKKRLGDIKQHTLIFHPRHDDQSDLSNAILLQRRLGGMVEMCVLDDSYHMVTLDRQRTIVVDRTVDFAARLTQRIEEREQVARIKGAAAAPSAPALAPAQQPAARQLSAVRRNAADQPARGSR